MSKAKAWSKIVQALRAASAAAAALFVVFAFELTFIFLVSHRTWNDAGNFDPEKSREWLRIFWFSLAPISVVGFSIYALFVAALAARLKKTSGRAIVFIAVAIGLVFGLALISFITLDSGTWSYILLRILVILPLAALIPLCATVIFCAIGGIPWRERKN